VRAVHECMQAVLWSGTVGLMPLVHTPSEGLTAVPLLDMPPSRLVVAWNEADTSPLVRSFVHLAATLYRSDQRSGGMLWLRWKALPGS
jgi:hypothetical protein